MANRWIAARATTTAPATQAMVHVLSAATNLPLGTKIDTRHVTSVDMVKGQEPSTSFHDFKEIEGKVTTTNVQAGQLLMASQFGNEGESALAGAVAKNKRAVTVRVDDVVGVAGFLLPGNTVDVVATSVDMRTNIATSETIVSNVKVLAVDQTVATNNNEPVVVRAVTLEVTPAEAETLLKGKALGTIQLALRNPLDDSDARHKHEPVKAVAKIAARAPIADKSITVIRGTDIGHEATASHD
jgi:pilus assembly protein CpaB